MLFRSYIEFNLNEIINNKKNIEILVVKNNYWKKKIINWTVDNLSYYNDILKENESIFINCDMYDEFLPWKILIKKKSSLIYLKYIKHYIK